MSRDREGAVSPRFRYEHRHRRALLLDYVSNCSPYIGRLEQPSRAPMPRPSVSVLDADSAFVQASAGEGFEIVHDFFRLCFGLDDDVNARHSYMYGQERPLAIQTNLSNRDQHNPSTLRAQEVRGLVHQFALKGGARCIRVQSAVTGNIMVPVDGTDSSPWRWEP